MRQRKHRTRLLWRRRKQGMMRGAQGAPMAEGKGQARDGARTAAIPEGMADAMQEEGKALVAYRFPDGEIEAQMVQPGLSDGSGVWLPEAVVF